MSTIKIKAKDLFMIQNGLRAVNDEKQCMKNAEFKFKYAIARNTTKIDKQVDDIKVQTKWPPEFQEYSRKRLEIRKRLASKDDRGMPLVMDNDYVLPDESVFDNEHKALEERFKTVIDEKRKNDQAFNDSMDEEIDIEIYEIDKDWIPEDITPGQLSGIILLVKEE